jgi:hypothetical protein
MTLLIKVFLLAAMIRLLIATEKPLLCAGIYAACAFALGAMFRDDITGVVLITGITFAGAFVYFWILDRLGNSSILWWILAVGVGVPLVFL